MTIATKNSYRALSLILLSLTLGGCATPSLMSHSTDMSGMAIVPDATEPGAATIDLTPVDGAPVSSPYGERYHPILHEIKMHDGVDFAASTGTPIAAAGSGEIEAIGPCGTYGNYIRIRHSPSFETAYAHLDSFAEGMEVGEHVDQGEVIGYVGATGLATGPNLHFEVLVDNEQVDPSALERADSTMVAQAHGPTFSERVSGWYRSALN